MGCLTPWTHTIKTQFRRLQGTFSSRTSNLGHRHQTRSGSSVKRHDISYPQNVRKEQDPFGSLFALLGAHGEIDKSNEYVEQTQGLHLQLYFQRS